ncbi:toprim domain-containing protein [Pantoea sp. SGAir0180]
MLFRSTDNVICCYDGDRAGREAAWRALETALPYMNDGRQLRFMFLPDGEDRTRWFAKKVKPHSKRGWSRLCRSLRFVRQPVAAGRFKLS